MEILLEVLKPSVEQHEFNLNVDFARFKEQVEEHKSLFHPVELHALATDFIKSYFTHYDLYRYAFTHTSEAHIIHTECILQTPVGIQPLDAALEEVNVVPVEEAPPQAEDEDLDDVDEDVDFDREGADEPAVTFEAGESPGSEDEESLGDPEFAEIFAKVDRKMRKTVDKGMKQINETVEREIATARSANSAQANARRK